MIYVWPLHVLNVKQTERCDYDDEMSRDRATVATEQVFFPKHFTFQMLNLQLYLSYILPIFIKEPA